MNVKGYLIDSIIWSNASCVVIPVVSALFCAIFKSSLNSLTPQNVERLASLSISLEHSSNDVFNQLSSLSFS